MPVTLPTELDDGRSHRVRVVIESDARIDRDGDILFAGGGWINLNSFHYSLSVEVVAPPLKVGDILTGRRGSDPEPPDGTVLRYIDDGIITRLGNKWYHPGTTGGYAWHIVTHADLQVLHVGGES